MNRDRLWGLLWVAAVAAVLLLGTVLGLVPKTEEARAAAIETTVVETQNAAYEAALASLKKDYERIDDLKNDLVDLQIGVPLTADIPTFLTQLDSIAVKGGVTLDQISVSDGAGYVPMEPVATAEVTDNADVVVATDVPVLDLIPANYISVPISLEATGTSSSVLTFLSELQYGDRIVAINSFSTDATSEAVTISISAEIYVLVDEPAAVIP